MPKSKGRKDEKTTATLGDGTSQGAWDHRPSMHCDVEVPRGRAPTRLGSLFILGSPGRVETPCRQTMGCGGGGLQTRTALGVLWARLPQGTAFCLQGVARHGGQSIRSQETFPVANRFSCASFEHLIFHRAASRRADQSLLLQGHNRNVAYTASLPRAPGSLCARDGQS